VGVGVGVGVAVGVGVGVGGGLAVGDGSVASGLGSVAVGVGVGLAVALGLALGVAAAPMRATLIASAVPAPAAAEGRLPHALAVLIGPTLEACAAEPPIAPLDTSNSPAATPNEARPNDSVTVVTPPSRCRPQRRRRCCVP
jgi:hypothetical protein